MSERFLSEVQSSIKNTPMAKVLLVTDYNGVLHITPTGNKDYYKSRNAVIKTQQFKFRDMEEDEAYAFVKKNNGIDPEFKTPAQVNKVLEDKDKELNELRKQLAEANDPNGEIAKLRAQLAALSTASTSTGAYQKLAADAANATNNSAGSQSSDDILKATDLIAKIGEAKSADEVKSLVPATETRKTVTDAAAKKLEEFKK